MTFSESVLSVADRSGTISYTLATKIAENHSLTQEFHWQYREKTVHSRIDAKELLEWLGY